MAHTRIRKFRCANGVITAPDPSGRIRIRSCATPTDVVIDRIGRLI